MDAQCIYMYIQEIFQIFKNAKQDEFAINHLMYAQFLKEYYLNIHISKISVHYLRTKYTYDIYKP